MKDAIYMDVMQEVAEKGVMLTDFKSLTKVERKYLEDYFIKEIVPLLSVMIVGRKQPFPFLKGQEIYVLAVLGTRNDKKKIGIIPCNSTVFPRLIQIPTKPDNLYAGGGTHSAFPAKKYIKDTKCLKISDSCDKKCRH